MRQHALAHNIPVISCANAAFLRAVLTQAQPRRVLEIGSAIGVSTIEIAHTLAAWGGQLVSIEISVPTQAAAQANLDELGLSNVQSLCGDARDYLSRWANALPDESGTSDNSGKKDQASTPDKHGLQDTVMPFDAVFIDAHKNQTHAFFAACLPMLTSNALVIVDDAWRFRHKMQAFYALLAQHNRPYSLHFIDNTDATLLLYLN